MSDYKLFISEFEKAVTSAKRDINEIELIAVSKKKPSPDIKKIINLKHISYGEKQIK